MILVCAALFFAFGLAAVHRLWDRESGEPVAVFERICYGAVIGAAAWLASDWLLALTHSFTKTALIVRTIVLLITVVALEKKRLVAIGEAMGRTRTHSSQVIVAALSLCPLFLWVIFILWRGNVIPPVTHDALAYHLPKATLMVRDAGYRYRADLHPLIRGLPANYELLLAESIAWDGDDQHTVWVSAVFYLLLCVASGALIQRWWTSSAMPAIVVMICVGSIPVVLLHSGAHKNDLMTSSLMIASAVGVGRFISARDERALAVGVIALAAAIGTKPQAGILALFLAPIILFCLPRRSFALSALKLIALSIIALFLLGGTVYACNLIHGSVLGNGGRAGGSLGVPYGDWSTLWQGPYILLTAPFSPSAYALPVPWASRPWFWRRNEIYFSHLGALFSIAAVAAPITIVASKWLRQYGRARERALISTAALASFLVILPVYFAPHGMYAISLPRYVLFVVPVVFGWTIAPLVVKLEERSRWGAPAVLLVAAALFVANAIEYGSRDRFAPIEYVLWARENRGTRVVAFDPNRAASIVDRVAGPADRIAIDAAFGTWIQPAFGPRLSRPVEFIQPGAGPPVISDDAKWVIVDRAFKIVWGHPDFHDLSQVSQYLMRGKPTAEDLRVFNYLRGDKRFTLVFYNPDMLQAVFRRR